MQQKGLLQQLSPVEMPQEVHPKLQRANELLQQQIKLLDEQTTVMAVSNSATFSLVTEDSCNGTVSSVRSLSVVAWLVNPVHSTLEPVFCGATSSYDCCSECLEFSV